MLFNELKRFLVSIETDNLTVINSKGKKYGINWIIAFLKHKHRKFDFL